MLRSCEASKRTAVAVMVSVHLTDGVEKPLAAEAADRLRSFRGELYGCLERRADELFEQTDALLCAEGPVRSLVGLCLAPEHRRGHGALDDAVNHGSVDADRLREALVRLPVPRMFGGRIVLAVDATPWLRPDAVCCPERLFATCRAAAAGGRPISRSRVGPTSWSSRWRAGPPAGPPRWTRSGWDRPRTPPRSPRPSCARWSVGCA